MSLIETTTPIGSYAPDFELLGIDEQVHHLGRYLKHHTAIGVVFLCNECSYVWEYIERLKKLQKQFEKQQFTIIGINANHGNQYHEESIKTMKEFARKNQLNFPYLWDATQDVARGFGVQQTPAAFLIDQAGILRYGGAIDDSHQAEAVQESYLEKAIASLLADTEISPKLTKVIGCPLKWRQ
ncbi:MAG: thioredoxin family protein [Coleofasciculaceae cyanobacterium]